MSDQDLIPPFLRRDPDAEFWKHVADETRADLSSPDDEPEISITAYEKLDRWRDKLDQAPKIDKRDVFERAADDLFLEAEFERDLGAWRAIRDAVYELGRDHAGLNDDSIQFVMVGAQGKVERLSNGHANGATAKSAEPPPEQSPDDYGQSAPIEEPHQSDKAPKPIQWLDMSAWDDEPRPQRKWAIRDRVPLGQVGLFSGEGGAGKSILELMRNAAHVGAKDWMGCLPEPRPALYFGTEDTEEELHIRLCDVLAHYGMRFKEAIEGGLYVKCLFGKDATLCSVTRSGKVEVTALYRELYEAAGDVKPINISIDTLTRCFAGSEIDRVQVYAFANHMQALAEVANGSVTVLSHPSLAGIQSGSGISGSTAWHGAFRFRMYLRGVKNAASGDETASRLRELEFKKNQYGPLGETVTLEFRNGLYLPVNAIGGLEKIAADQSVDDLFLELLAKFADQGRNVTHSKTSNNFAPTVFANDPSATKIPNAKKGFGQAMERLFAANKISGCSPLTRLRSKTTAGRHGRLTGSLPHPQQQGTRARTS